VHTLFAPSPGHDLHIGHVWTAWLNWDHAKRSGGDFIVLWDRNTYDWGAGWHCGYEFGHGVDRIREQLEWLGMPPGRECWSEQWDAEHREACARLGYKWPEPRGIAAWQLHKPVGCETLAEPALHHRMPYAPALTTCYVVDDHLAGVHEYYTGDEFLDERLHYEDIAFRLGIIPPRREYVPTVARGLSKGKESKSDGACTVCQLRDAGYEPWQILSTLRECQRRSALAGHAHVVVPYGYLTPERVRWLRYRGDIEELRGLIHYSEHWAADGDPRFMAATGDIRARCELEIRRDLQRQRELLG
jgi:hypothetical protein